MAEADPALFYAGYGYPYAYGLHAFAGKVCIMNDIDRVVNINININIISISISILI